MIFMENLNENSSQMLCDIDKMNCKPVITTNEFKTDIIKMENDEEKEFNV